MRRLGLVLATGALLGMFAAALSASPALAGRGHKWQYVAAKPMTLPAVYCGFKVRLTFPRDKEYGKLLKTSNGSMISLFTGSFRVTFTNPANGKSITENANSPLKQTSTPTSIILKNGGHVGLLLTPGDAKRFGLPGISVTAGQVTATIALATGAITSLTLHGHVAVDVCTALS
jgi:hypothetical protein